MHKVYTPESSGDIYVIYCLRQCSTAEGFSNNPGQLVR